MSCIGFKEIIGNRPNEITDDIIEDWLNKFCKCMNSEYNNTITMDGFIDSHGEIDVVFYKFINRITLEFSDEKPQIIYKKWLNYAEIIKEIIKHYNLDFNGQNDPFRRLEIFSRERLIDALDELSSIISGLINEKVSIKEIKKYIKSLVNKRINMARAGVYCHNELKIILYNSVICRDVKKIRIEDIQEYEHILAHELFHAFHYYYGINNGDIREFVCRFDYTPTVVKESLAAYFQYIYCDINNNYDAKHALEEDWEENLVVDYPYSGAKFIKNNGNGYFVDAIDDSIDDMDAALRRILCREDIKYRIVSIGDFYDVKNKDRYFNSSSVKIKTIDKPTSKVKGIPLYLEPKDVNIFYNQLKLSQKFVIVYVYSDGHTKIDVTESKNIKSASNLLNNIKTGKIKYEDLTDVIYIRVLCC